MLALAGPEGLRVASVPDLLIWIEARPPTDRPGVNPRRLYDGTRWIMARHPADFEQQSRLSALFDGVAGTNAARLGDWRPARRRLWRAVRADPRSREAWSRLALATVPAVGERVWQRHGAWSTHDRSEVGVLRQPPPVDDVRLEGDVTAPATARGDVEPPASCSWPGATRRTPRPPTPTARRPPAPACPPNDPTPRPPCRRSPTASPVGRAASPSSRSRSTAPVAGLRPRPRPAARHSPSAPACTGPTTPVALLHALTAAAGTGRILLATPDRIVSDPGRPYGPPSDPAHRREWTLDQLELLLLSCGLDLERWWHVRSTGATPLDRVAAQVPAVPIPGVRRDTMVVLAAPRPAAS